MGKELIIAYCSKMNVSQTEDVSDVVFCGIKNSANSNRFFNLMCPYRRLVTVMDNDLALNNHQFRSDFAQSFHFHVRVSNDVNKSYSISFLLLMLAHAGMNTDALNSYTNSLFEPIFL